jgi:DNA-binding PadR family transcriptional regulator
MSSGGGNVADQNILAIMMTELRRGTLSLAVLSQLREPQYGYSLLQCLEAKGIQIEANTLYPLMRRLETQAFWKTAGTQHRQGPEILCVERGGQEIYTELKKEWEKPARGSTGF